jgi:hypothetical protein
VGLVERIAEFLARLHPLPPPHDLGCRGGGLTLEGRVLELATEADPPEPQPVAAMTANATAEQT